MNAHMWTRLTVNDRTSWCLVVVASVPSGARVRVRVGHPKFI